MMGAWLQKHRVSLLFFLIILTLGGLLTAFKMPVALFPNISFPRIVVSVDSGDRPVDRMLIEVTRPLEQALRSVPNLVNIRSTSSRGSAELSINFEWGTDMVAALLQVQAAVNQALVNLPPGTSFTAERMATTTFPIVGLTLTSTKRNLIELRDFTYYQLRPLLSIVPGIARLQTLGGKNAEYQVLLDPPKLRALGLTLDDVGKALAANNVVEAVGHIEDYYHLYLILSDARLHQLDDIKHTILRAGKNGVVKLDDVAQVVSGTVPQWIRVTANGHDAVLLNIIQQMNANTVAIVKDLKTRLAEIKNQIPADIQIKTYYNQADLVTDSAFSVFHAILIGAILAAIILVFFLRNLRMTLIVAFILPCVLATTVLLLHLFHMSFNMMTLGGMAAAVGLIIDDGVVMLEHIMRRLSERHQGESTHGPVMNASLQMLQPLAGSSLATIVIFLPLAFLQGVTGGFFKSLALTMASALIISFFYVFLAVPLLGERMLKREDAKHLERVGAVLGCLHQHYRQFMSKLLIQPRWLLGIFIALLILALASFLEVGTGFMPRMDEGGFVMDYIAPPGTSLTETDRLLRQVEKIIISIPEVDSYSRRTGAQLGANFLTEANAGDIFIHLKPPPRRGIEDIMAEVREKVNHEVPLLRIETAQLMEDMIGDLTAVPQPIEVKIFGDNPDQLQPLAREVAERLHSVPGVVEIKDGIVISGDAVNIQIDRLKASLLGLDPNAVTQQLRTLLMGTLISQIQSGPKMIGIRIWMPQDLRERIAQLQTLSLRTANGHYVSLRQVAAINILNGQAEIDQENMKPMLAVTARIEGRDLGSTMRDVQSTIKKLNLPLGVYIEYGGLYQEQQKSFFDLMFVFVSAVLLVALLLLFLYENIFIVISTIVTTLLSLTGVFLGLWITGIELNISAMMGMTMIVGMVTEIAIFYFSELKSYSQQGVQELILAGIKRMRPILMTTIIAILALMPLALGLGTGSTMQQPLAIAIISGLIFALPLVLCFMPGLYLTLKGKFATKVSE